MGQSVTVDALLHVSRKAHISSFDENQQVLAIHHLARLDGPVCFEDDGMLEDVFGKGVPMMDQKLAGATSPRSSQTIFILPQTERRGRPGRRARPRGDGSRRRRI